MAYFQVKTYSVAGLHNKVYYSGEKVKNSQFVPNSTGELVQKGFLKPLDKNNDTAQEVIDPDTTPSKSLSSPDGEEDIALQDAVVDKKEEIKPEKAGKKSGLLESAMKQISDKPKKKK